MVHIRMRSRIKLIYLLEKELESMPEVADKYMGAEILLTTGHKIVRGHVVT